MNTAALGALAAPHPWIGPPNVAVTEFPNADATTLRNRAMAATEFNPDMFYCGSMEPKCEVCDYDF